MKLLRRITNEEVPETLRTCGLGAVLARVPDLDGDGRDDLAVTASGNGAHVPACANANRREFVFLFGSARGAFLAAVAPPDEQKMPVSFGCAITVLDDVDADGTGDFAIGQFMAMRDDERSVGATYVISGKTRGVLSSVWGVEHENDFGRALAADRSQGRLVVCDLNDVFVYAVSGTACVLERTLRLR